MVDAELDTAGQSEQIADAGQEPEPSAEPTAEQTTDYIELPPKVQSRFNRIYANMKDYERKLHEQTAINKRLTDKLSAIEQQTGAKTGVDMLTQMKAARRQAIETGDLDTADQIDDQMFDMRLRIMAAQAQPQADNGQQQPANSGNNSTQQANQLTPEQIQRITEWSDEHDESGTHLRPWSSPGHPQHDRMKSLAASMMLEPKYQDMDLDDFLTDLDKTMNLVAGPRQSQRATVLKPDANRRPTGTKTSLSTEQKAVADRMGITHDAYAANLTSAR